MICLFKHCLLLLLFFSCGIDTSLQAQIVDQKIYYVQDKRVPMTYVTISFHNMGWVKETKGGIPYIISQLMFRIPNSAVDSAGRQLVLLGARPETEMSWDTFEIKITTQSKHLGEVITLMNTILHQTDFSKIETASHLIQVYKKEKKRNLDNLLSVAAWYSLYGDTNFMGGKSMQELKEVKSQDIQDFYLSILSSPITYRVISDLSYRQIETAVRSFKLGNEENSFDHLENEWEMKGGKALLIESPGRDLYECYWLFNSINQSRRDYLTLQIIVDALGGDQHSLLLEHMRDRKSLCYGIAANLENWIRPGYVSIYTKVRPNHTDELILELVDFLENLEKNERFWEKIEDSKAKFKHQYSYSQRLENKLKLMIKQDQYQVPILEREEYRTFIDNIDRAQVKTVLSETLSFQNVRLIFRGDVERLSSAIQSIRGLDNVEVIEQADLGL